MTFCIVAKTGTILSHDIDLGHTASNNGLLI